MLSAQAEVGRISACLPEDQSSALRAGGGEPEEPQVEPVASLMPSVPKSTRPPPHRSRARRGRLSCTLVCSTRALKDLVPARGLHDAGGAGTWVSRLAVSSEGVLVCQTFCRFRLCRPAPGCCE